MFQIVGIVVLFALVFGSFIMTGGNIAVILGALPSEMMTIGGAGIASVLIANSLGVLKGLGGGMGKVFKGPSWKASDYRDLLSLLFLLTKTMKSKGVIALESHIEKPGESTRRSLRPVMSMDQICDPPPAPLAPDCSVRVNISTRPFGAHVGPSSCQPWVNVRSPDPSGRITQIPK